MTRSLVTGGSGFIGSHVVDALRSAGHEVVVLDRCEPHRRDVQFQSGDITDLSSVRKAMKGVDYVHHLAAVSNVNHAFDNPLQCVQTNVMGAATVIDAARTEQVKRVLFASSVWVYNGAREDTVSEDTPLHMPGPGHVYTSTKIAIELMLHDYAVLYKVPFTIFRYGIPYGPRMRPELLIPIFLKRALSSQPLLVAGKGSQARSFVYVEDLARAHVLGLHERCANQTFNLEGERGVSVLEVAEAVRGLVGRHVAIEHTPGRPGDYEGKNVLRDKAERVLDWHTKVGFEDGMRRTFEWYRATYGGHERGAEAAAIAS